MNVNVRKLFAAISAALCVSLLAGSLSMTASADVYNWSDISGEVEKSGLESVFIVDRAFGIRHWLPTVFSADEITEEESESGLITRYTYPDAKWTVELYSYNYEEGAFADLEEYQAFLEEIGYENIHNDVINGMDVLTYGSEENDEAIVTFIDRDDEIAEMIFSPMSDSEFNSIATAIMLSIQQVTIVDWDETIQMMGPPEDSGRFFELEGMDVAYWMPDELNELELGEVDKDSGFIAAFRHNDEDLEIYFQEIPFEDVQKVAAKKAVKSGADKADADKAGDAKAEEKAEKSEDAKADDKADKSDAKKAGKSDNKQAAKSGAKQADEAAVEYEFVLTAEAVAAYLEDAGASNIERAYINELECLTCEFEEYGIMSVAIFNDKTLITLNFAPLTDYDYSELIYEITSSLQSNIVQLDWSEIEPLIKDEIDGEFYTYDNVNAAVWIPDILGEIKLTQDDIEDGYLGVYCTADAENVITVKHTVLDESASYEELLEFLEDIGATDITKAMVNGYRAVSYTLEDDNTGSMMLMSDDSDLLLEVQFYPVSDEDFASIAQIIMASAMLTKPEK